MSMFKSIFGKEKLPVESGESPAAKFDADATVLIVDDSKTVLFTIDRLMQSLGLKTLTATSAQDGIELAENLLPDLILMDVVMPGMNGFQATRMLRKIEVTRNIPIIIISGNKMQTEQLWGQRLGANGFLPKPVDKAAFIDLASNLLTLQKAADT